jgi:hypothetical protein
MHLLTIVFGPVPTPWSLLFKKPELADKTFADLQIAKKEKAEQVSVMDEFGQRADIDVKSIHGFMLEDMEQSKLAHIERGLHQARTQARAQQMAGSDPVLKNAAMMQSPAMLSPMGNGRFPS